MTGIKCILPKEIILVLLRIISNMQLCIYKIAIMFYYMDAQDIRSILGINIKKHRKRLKLTQEVLADMVGSNSSHIAQLENGKIFISCDMLAKMCNVFEVLPNSLFETKSAKTNREAKENIEIINIALKNLNNNELVKISKLINCICSENIIDDK